MSAEKQLELLKFKTLVIATIDYLIERYCGELVMDGVDHMKNFYENEKIQAIKYFDNRNLKSLKQKFINLTRQVQNNTDLNFNGYIKENTGYEVDVFKNLHDHFETLIANGNVSNKEDLDGCNIMFGYYEKTGNTEMYEKLKTFYVNNMDMVEESTLKYSKVTSRVEKDGDVIETVAISNRPIASNYKKTDEMIISPDGKRKILISQWVNGKDAMKNLSVLFPTSSGCIYSVKGICPDVSAYWKDNNTIVVETNKNYEGYPGVKELRSFDDKIKIEYIDH